MTKAQAKAAAAPAAMTIELVPRFARWAQTRVVDEKLGGDISLRQLSALQMIASDETTTLGDVAKQLMVTPAVVTGLIDRLEKRGYVRRVASSGDRRRVNLALTDSGKETAKQCNQRLNGEVAAKLASYPTDDLKALEQGLEILEKVLKELQSDRSTGRR